MTLPPLRGEASRWRSRTAFFVVALVVVPLGACGLGEKEEYADRVTASTARAIEAGTVKGTLTATMRLSQAPIEIPPGVEGISMSAAFVADLGRHRSLLQEQHLLHDDLVLHLRRADAEENDARPWLTLDLDDLNADARLPFSNSNPIRMPYIAFAIPPTVLVDLIAGALTGSLEAVGREDIEGTPVRGYRANFDIEKMLSDTREDAYDAARREAVERTFETLDIGSTVHPGTVWLDDEGRPRRFEVTFDVKPRNRWTFATTVTVDLVEWGIDAPFDLPQVEESIKIGSISRLMTELGRSFPMPEMRALPGQTPPSTLLPSEQPPPEGIEQEEAA